MRLSQVLWNGKVTAAIFDQEGLARPIPDYTMQDLIRRSEVDNISLAELARRQAMAHAEPLNPILPIHPREVWACGCTYEMSAAFRDAEHNTREGFYAYVFNAANRPESFFKGTARVCVGPGQPIGIRADSNFTAPEPELAVVMGQGGKILGYTLANDVSAWDIEKENPLYLPQSKVFNACCALGPVIVTPDELDPYQLEMTCTIQRGGQEVFRGSVSTAKLNRRIETLIEYLFRANSVPSGSVLCTGTGIIVKEDNALQPGDVVTITVPEIGTLSNPAAIVH
jgi:2-dehydro-3-deoxy-D-arabinonate dehydratase